MTNSAQDIVAYLLESDAEIAADIAKHAGDRVFEIVRMHAMTMPTTGGAILLGALLARQVLGDTIEFATRSMEGTDADVQTVRAAVLEIFDDFLAEIRNPNPQANGGEDA